MQDARALGRYRTGGRVIGAIVLGSLLLVAAVLQPIDGVPGYQLITPDDYSIVFGFALAFAVGAVAGGWLGGWIGARLAERQFAVQPAPAEAAAAPAASPGRYQLLTALLSAMPPDTQRDVAANFARLKADLEFFTFVPLERAQALADEAGRRGFVIWCNTDERSAMLYGATLLARDGQLTETVTWLRSITAPGMKGQVVVQPPEGALRVIEFDSAQA